MDKHATAFVLVPITSFGKPGPAGLLRALRPDAEPFPSVLEVLERISARLCAFIKDLHLMTQAAGLVLSSRIFHGVSHQFRDSSKHGISPSKVLQYRTQALRINELEFELI